MKIIFITLSLICTFLECSSQSLFNTLNKTEQVEFLSSINAHYYRFKGNEGDLFDSIKDNSLSYHDVFSKLESKYLQSRDLYMYSGLRSLISQLDNKYYEENFLKPELLLQIEQVFLNEEAKTITLQKHPNLNSRPDLHTGEIYDPYERSLRIIQDLIVLDLRTKNLYHPIAVDYCFSRLSDKKNARNFNFYMYYFSDCCRGNIEVVAQLKNLLGSLEYHNLSSLRKLFKELFEE